MTVTISDLSDAPDAEGTRVIEPDDDDVATMKRKLANWAVSYERDEGIPFHPDLLWFLDWEVTEAPKCIETRKPHLKIYNEWLQNRGIEPQGATKKQIHKFFRGLEADEYSENYIKSIFRTLNHYYLGFLTEWEEVIDESPMDDLSEGDYGGSSKKENGDPHQKYLRRDQKEKLVANVETPKTRNHAIIETMWQTGLRAVEVTEIKLENIDWGNNQLTTWSSKKGENGDWHTVVFQESLKPLLRRYIDGPREVSRHADSPYLFVSQESGQLRRNSINRIVRDAARNAGIDKKLRETQDGRTKYWPTAHSLRHGHAIEALRSPEITMKDLQQQLGHHKVTVTSEIYLDMLPEERQQAYQHFGQRRE